MAATTNCTRLSNNGKYSSPLHHSNHQFYTNRSERKNIFPSPTNMRLPAVMSYRTSYKSDYAKKEKIPQQLPRPQSPTRKNRPHPMNVYYLERLDARQLVCDVKSETKGDKVDIIGAPTRNAQMFLRTCTQESFGEHSLAPDCVNTRYGSNKHKYSPARGIVPIIGKDINILRKDDHWLPGTLKLTTTMTMQGPFQYLTRKRKHIFLDKSAAGMLGGIQSEEHRYHNIPKCRGLTTPRLTLRSGI